ncbi:MAG: flagellar biosynthesis protein FliQ [Candidatus Marinimicrobia bacterium]|nr:flagellar biosynthesis protein FliQ [Candidatus Neomarinimicrobiota bacterium]
MSIDYVVAISRETLMTSIYILAPILGVGLVVGLLVAIFQAITQIHEMTLTFIPKMAVVGLVLMIFMPWFLDIILAFTREIYGQIPLMTQ